MEPETVNFVSPDSNEEFKFGVQYDAEEYYTWGTFYIYAEDEWHPIKFDGKYFPGSDWIVGEGRESITLGGRDLPEGKYYAVAYSCERVGNEWDCNDNKWMLRTFTVSHSKLPPAPVKPEPITPEGSFGILIEGTIGSLEYQGSKEVGCAPISNECDKAYLAIYENSESSAMVVVQEYDYFSESDAIEFGKLMGRSNGLQLSTDEHILSSAIFHFDSNEAEIIYYVHEGNDLHYLIYIYGSKNTDGLNLMNTYLENYGPISFDIVEPSKYDYEGDGVYDFTTSGGDFKVKIGEGEHDFNVRLFRGTVIINSSSGITELKEGEKTYTGPNMMIHVDTIINEFAHLSLSNVCQINGNRNPGDMIILSDNISLQGCDLLFTEKDIGQMMCDYTSGDVDKVDVYWGESLIGGHATLDNTTLCPAESVTHDRISLSEWTYDNITTVSVNINSPTEDYKFPILISENGAYPTAQFLYDANYIEVGDSFILSQDRKTQFLKYLGSNSSFGDGNATISFQNLVSEEFIDEKFTIGMYSTEGFFSLLNTDFKFRNGSDASSGTSNFDLILVGRQVDNQIATEGGNLITLFNTLPDADEFVVYLGEEGTDGFTTVSISYDNGFKYFAEVSDGEGGNYAIGFNETLVSGSGSTFRYDENGFEKIVVNI